MTISETVQLPDQPTKGAVEFIPLGGDGFSAPKFAYTVLTAELTGDSSGGTMSMRIEMDPRWSAVVGYVTGQIVQQTPADAEHLFTITGDRVPTLLHQGDITNTVLSTSEIGFTWRPEPLVLPGGTTAVPPALQVRFLNVDGDLVRMSALIFCYDIRVRELTPMGPILWARGT